MQSKIFSDEAFNASERLKRLTLFGFIAVNAISVHAEISIQQREDLWHICETKKTIFSGFAMEVAEI